MHIAKPPGGFKLEISPSCKGLIESHQDNVKKHIYGVFERLRHTGHREGVVDDRLNGKRMFKARSNPILDLPSVVVVYHVLGDTLKVEWLAVG